MLKNFVDDKRAKAAFWHVTAVVCTGIMLSVYCSAGVYFRADDVLFHMARIEGIADGLRSGIFPVWINAFLLNGYGVPEGIMYPDTFLYPSALLRLAGMPLSLVYNVYWIGLVLLGMLGSYYAYSRWLGGYGRGCLAAVLYNCCYYFLFVNGIFVGACAAMAAYPLTIFGVWSVLRGDSGRWYLAVLGMCVICQSNLTGTLLVAVMVAAMLVLFRDGLQDADRRRALFLACFFGVLLNLWRMVPVLDFYPRMLFHINDIENYFNGYFASMSGVTFYWPELVHDGFLWGWPLTVLMLLFGVLRLGRWRESRGWYAVLFLCFLITLGMWEGFPWPFFESLPVLGSVLPKFQFSMRFIHLGLVPLAYYLAKYMGEIAEKALWRQWLLAGGCIALSFWALYMSMFMQIHMKGIVGDMSSEHRLVENISSTGVYTYQDYLYADIAFDELRNRQNEPRKGGREDIHTDAEILSFSKESSRIRMAYNVAQDTVAELPLFFFHGYAGMLEDGRDVTVGETEEHVMTVFLPAGEHEVTVWFRGLWSYRIAGWLSLAGVAMFAICLYGEWRKGRCG